MLKRTPFYSEHEKLGAKLIDFGGFEMPVQYAGIKQEHTAVREKAGLFDVSHMGEFFVSGSEALNLIQKMTINDASKLKPGKAQYSAMCYEDGGIVDDLLVYMLDLEEYMLVVNASNIEKDWRWIVSQNSMKAQIENRSEEIALLALQGPASADILQKLTDTDVASISFYTFENGSVAGEENVIISATGYTGEKGFELYIDTAKSDPVAIWNALFFAGKEFDLEPAGLGARDTLRLEMGYALYGNDITRDTTPLEARMGWLTKLDKGEFVGRTALLKQKENGVERKLMGLELSAPRSVPRTGYDILDKEGNDIGFVTSGTQSISLEKGIGMGYVSAENAVPGNSVRVRIRKKEADAVIVKPPFYKK
ncbi:glycine cleavage system aminomethyltransferase GcvT [Rhodohalobacter mucosus]|uniref:Aminomethyltransferase n=1 Tax=Rhodohalobacter mucosus TaxID=2079485 RepID=A0A316TWZ0_9BACT|nr:glycine cleavage system aminomethyltransferase GcvT [Rhodohalobacter mucosus]PWN07929.1 glycine cleavage system aminomethyltransferase GcvT [Rhodohalobacter mucosus]